MNRRPPRKDQRDNYAYFRVVLNGTPLGWNPVATVTPQIFYITGALTPTAPVPWPGRITFLVGAGIYVAGSLALYAYIDRATGAYERGNTFYVLYGEGGGGESIVGPDISYEFSNRPYSTDPVEYTRPGAPSLYPGASDNGDPNHWKGPPEPGAFPEVAPLPLVPVPVVPLPVPGLPPAPRPVPVPQPAPLAPATPALPGTTPARLPITEPLFTPRRLPAPLATPAPATRSLTGTGRLPVAVPAIPAITPKELRQYGPVTVTGGTPRTDPQSVAQEVGRIEQKLAILLGRPQVAPDWTDAVLNGIAQALAGQIIDALAVDVPAIAYEFVAPCDKGETGESVTHIQDIPAADYPEAIVARLDAIAAAMGVLKGWKQPLCRTSPPKSNVTVTAYEVGGEF